jgi:D-psicose/D-tagatose/L-ribulose 3-epimerase
MPRFGAHAFIWASEWTPVASERVIKGAAEAGLDFVEIPLLRPRNFDIGHTTDLLSRYGVAATCSLGLPAEASLPDAPDAAETFLQDALEVAAKLGSPILSGVIYGTLGTLSGHPPREEELETVAATLKRVAKRASTLSLELGVEPVNRYETYLVNLTRQGLELLERIGEDNVFLHLDTYHMNIEERGFREPILAAGSRLKYIHLSESDRGTPGTGNVRWDEVFSGLAEIGYGGDLVMESFVALNPHIARATCIWRPVVEDPERLVRDGLAFLKGHAVRTGLLERPAAG